MGSVHAIQGERDPRGRLTRVEQRRQDEVRQARDRRRIRTLDLRPQADHAYATPWQLPESPGA